MQAYLFVRDDLLFDNLHGVNLASRFILNLKDLGVAASTNDSKKIEVCQANLLRFRRDPGNAEAQFGLLFGSLSTRRR